MSERPPRVTTASEASEPATRAGDWERGEFRYRPRYKLLDEQRTRADQRAKQLLRRAGKLRATTPAGIHAKALLVRASVTGAAVLAMSLAEELIASRALRESLWPAEPAGMA
jgi:hypothetical protein